MHEAVRCLTSKPGDTDMHAYSEHIFIAHHRGNDTASKADIARFEGWIRYEVYGQDIPGRPRRVDVIETPCDVQVFLPLAIATTDDGGGDFAAGSNEMAMGGTLDHALGRKHVHLPPTTTTTGASPFNK